MVDSEDLPDPGADAPLIGAAAGPLLHVMSYNLKFAGGTSPHTWLERRPLVAAMLQHERPTILCTQEGRYRQLLELRSDLDGYDWIHLGRQGGSRSEATAIMWDAGRLAPLDYDHLWLSKRPHVVGSRSWGNRVVRMLTWVHFSDRLTGKRFYVVDNHFDHRSERSRRMSAKFLLDTVERFDAPAIVAGDFNCGVDSVAYRILTGSALADSWTMARQRLTPEWGTFNHWRPEPVEGDRRIDWILVRPGIEVHMAAINTYTKDGQAPSDHWPVQAMLSVM